MEEFYKIKEHWNKVGGKDYDYFWKASSARKDLAKRETDFVKSFINGRIFGLDYGIGSGRFFRVLLDNSAKDSLIRGADISEDMVEYCREKFRNNPKAGKIDVIDKYYLNNLSDKFNFIATIRVLKYNSNWGDILRGLFEKLDRGGIIIFSMANNYSTSGLYLRKTFYIKKSIKEMEELIKKSNLKILKVEGFAKLPDFLYGIKIISGLVLLKERILRKILGDKFLEREIFYACQKQ